MMPSTRQYMERPLVIARGILALIYEESSLCEMNSSGTYPVLLRNVEISRVHNLPKTGADHVIISINPLVELSTFVGDEAQLGEENVVDLLTGGYLNIEETRRVLIRNKTMEAVIPSDMDSNSVRKVLRDTLFSQLNSKQVLERDGFLKMVYTSQLAIDAYSQIGQEVDKVQSKIELVEKYKSKEWSPRDTFDRLFRTEPDNVWYALSTETEGFLSSAISTRVNAVCYANENLDSLFGSLPVAVYRSVILKLRFPDFKKEDLWTTLPTDKNGIVELGSSEVRFPRPGEIFSTSLRDVRIDSLLQAIVDGQIMDLFLEASKNGSVPLNTRLAFSNEVDVDTANAQKELDVIFTGKIPPPEIRTRALHPGRILPPTKDEIGKWSNRNDGINLGLPQGGLVEEPTTKDLVIESRYGKRQLVLSEGQYFIRSRYKTVLKAIFSTSLRIGPLGSIGFKSMELGDGQPVPVEWVINSLFMTKGKDAEIHARHAMFLYKQHEMCANEDSSCMFKNRSPDGKDLFAIFTSKFVREVDCILDITTGKVYMLLGGKMYPIIQVDDGNYTLGEIFSTPFHKLRRINVDIGSKHIGHIGSNT